MGTPQDLRRSMSRIPTLSSQSSLPRAPGITATTLKQTGTQTATGIPHGPGTSTASSVNESVQTNLTGDAVLSAASSDAGTVGLPMQGLSGAAPGHQRRISSGSSCSVASAAPASIPKPRPSSYPTLSAHGSSNGGAGVKTPRGAGIPMSPSLSRQPSTTTRYSPGPGMGLQAHTPTYSPAGYPTPSWDLAADQTQLETSKAQASNIMVAVRMRPLSDKEYARGDHEAWSLDTHQNIGYYKEGKFQAKYHYDHVFGQESCNAEVFDTLARPLVAPVLTGMSGTVFAYGVTSSGKTHTMMGSTRGEAGLVPLTVQELFACIQSAPQPPGVTVTYTVRLSMMEIYNEILNDLLAPGHTNLKLREDGSRGVVVEGLHEEVVSSAEQALACIARGEATRKVSSTAYNDDSSRSHTICRLVVEGVHMPSASQPAPSTPSTPASVSSRSPAPRTGKRSCDGAVKVTLGVISLIDLAGSESAKVSVSKGQRMEGSYINKSLLTLGTVINKLALVAQAAQASNHIPFRDSKLTRLLQNSMTGHGARIAIVCNITPAAAQFEETGNTLKFATRAKLVRVSVAAQQSVDERALLRKYRHELRELRAQLHALQTQQQVFAGSDSCSEETGSPFGPRESLPGLAGNEAFGDLLSLQHSCKQHGLEAPELRSKLQQAVQMLYVERQARLKAEQEVQMLEARLHGFTRFFLPDGGHSHAAHVQPAPRPGAQQATGGAGAQAGGGKQGTAKGVMQRPSSNPGLLSPSGSCAASDIPGGLTLHALVTTPSGGAAAHGHRAPSPGLRVTSPSEDGGTPHARSSQGGTVRLTSPVASVGDFGGSSDYSGSYDVDAELALMEQINQMQDDLQSGPASARSPTAGPPGTSLRPSHLFIPPAQPCSEPPSVVHTGCSGSVMGDADKDLEIQVLLADREVLQEQVINVELANEALQNQAEALASQMARVKAEAMQERHAKMQLEASVAELRRGKESASSELDALRAELARLQALVRERHAAQAEKARQEEVAAAAEAARQADAAQHAESVRLIEAARALDATRQAEAMRQAEAARQAAAVERARQEEQAIQEAEAAVRAELALHAQLEAQERQAQAVARARQEAQAVQLAEAAVQVELLHQAQVQVQAQPKHVDAMGLEERGRLAAEAAIQKELARQAGHVSGVTRSSSGGSTHHELYHIGSPSHVSNGQLPVITRPGTPPVVAPGPAPAPPRLHPPLLPPPPAPPLPGLNTLPAIVTLQQPGAVPGTSVPAMLLQAPLQTGNAHPSWMLVGGGPAAGI